MLIKFCSATFVTFSSCPVFVSFEANIESQYAGDFWYEIGFLFKFPKAISFDLIHLNIFHLLFRTVNESKKSPMFSEGPKNIYTLLIKGIVKV